MNRAVNVLRRPPAGRSHFLVLTGAATSDALCTSSAALQVTGDIDIRAAVALGDWTPGVPGTTGVVSKRLGSSGEFNFKVTSVGRLEISWYEGASLKILTSSVNPTVADGGLLAIRATREDTAGAGGVAVAHFYTKATTAATAAADCASDAGWTEIGVLQLAAGAAVPTATTNDVILGAQTFNAAAQAMNFYAAVIKAGVNGTTVASPDYTSGKVGARAISDGQGNQWRMAGPGYLS